MRKLVVILGDQLDPEARALAGLDPKRDAVWMAEVPREVAAPPAHQRRIAAFFSAMRHFRDALRETGITVHYTALSEDPTEDRASGLGEALLIDLQT